MFFARVRWVGRAGSGGCVIARLCKPFQIDRRVVLHRTSGATTPAKTGLIPSIACLWRIS